MDSPTSAFTFDDISKDLEISKMVKWYKAKFSQKANDPHFVEQFISDAPFIVETTFGCMSILFQSSAILKLLFNTLKETLTRLPNNEEFDNLKQFLLEQTDLIKREYQKDSSYIEYTKRFFEDLSKDIEKDKDKK